MENKVNRVEAAAAVLLDRERRLDGLFNLEDKPYNRHKLRELDKIVALYSKTKDPEELAALERVRKSQKETAMQAHGLLGRILRAVTLPGRIKAIQNEEATAQYRDAERIRDGLIRAGFGGDQVNLTKILSSGHSKTDFYLSREQANGERIDFVLQFQRDQEGKLQFSEYKAKLFSKELGLTRDHTFRLDDGTLTKSEHAVNLLYGRPILTEVETLEGAKKRIWQSLDFDDRTGDGQFRVRNIEHPPGYNLTTVLEKLALKGVPDLDRLSRTLEQGGREEITVTRNGQDEKYFIEADPRKNSVTVYDEKRNKTTALTEAAPLPDAKLKNEVTGEINKKQDSRRRSQKI